MCQCRKEITPTSFRRSFITPDGKSSREHQQSVPNRAAASPLVWVRLSSSAWSSKLKRRGCRASFRRQPLAPSLALALGDRATRLPQPRRMSIQFTGELIPPTFISTSINEMPFRLPPGKIEDILTIETGTLLQFYLDQLIIPFRDRHFYISFDRVAGIGINRPIALDRRLALIVPHSDRGARRVTDKTDGVCVNAAINFRPSALFSGLCENFVTGQSSFERGCQLILPTISGLHRCFQSLQNPLLT